MPWPVRIISLPPASLQTQSGTETLLSLTALTLLPTVSRCHGSLSDRENPAVTCHVDMATVGPDMGYQQGFLLLLIMESVP